MYSCSVWYIIVPLYTVLYVTIAVCHIANKDDDDDEEEEDDDDDVVCLNMPGCALVMFN